MAILNTVEQKGLLEFISSLREKLPNKELLEDLLNKLQPISYKETIVIAITDNVVAFKYPNGDTYSIHVDGSSIDAYYEQKSTDSSQRRTIIYQDEYVYVSLDETTTEIDELTGLPNIIVRQNDNKTYKDNELIFQRAFTTKATANTEAYTCETTSQDIYVSEDRIAYIRDLTISNNSNSKSGVTYRKCCSYNPTPFNNLINTEKRAEPFIYPSNENEFITSTAKIESKRKK